jgi:hypothetical protein
LQKNKGETMKNTKIGKQSSETLADQIALDAEMEGPISLPKKSDSILDHIWPLIYSIAGIALFIAILAYDGRTQEEIDRNRNVSTITELLKTSKEPDALIEKLPKKLTDSEIIWLSFVAKERPELQKKLFPYLVP